MLRTSWNLHRECDIIIILLLWIGMSRITYVLQSSIDRTHIYIELVLWNNDYLLRDSDERVNTVCPFAWQFCVGVINVVPLCDLLIVIRNYMPSIDPFLQNVRIEFLFHKKIKCNMLKTVRYNFLTI